MTGKWGRFVVLVAGLVGAVPAVADELQPDQARHFIAGRHFAYTCFDGTTGAGRIYADGSVVGSIRIGDNAPRFVALPAGTLKVSGSHYCAYMRGLPFSPCFNIDRTSQISFRGSISGLGFAYCDFHRRSTRADLLHSSPTRQRSSPLRLRPSMATVN